MSNTLTIGEIDLVTDETLAELVAHRSPACVSIFLPTHAAGPETKQDPIRLGNLLREAEAALVDDHGQSRRDVEALLAPARALLDDPEFWRFQSQGLALYVAPGMLRTVRAPHPFGQAVSVAPTFHLRPLLPLVSGDGHFFVLALSQNEVRLLEGTRFTMAEMSLGPIPPSMADALAHEDPEAQLQVRSGGEAGMYHGQGPGDEADKAALERYFRSVDRGLRERIGADAHPLVLASVAYYLPIYRSVTSHPALVDQCVEGSPEGLTATEPHDRSWPIVEPTFDSARAEADQSLAAAIGNDRAALGPLEVVTAALAGRVSTLLLADDETCWGRADADGVIVHDQQEPGDVDLLELAAVTTIGSGGQVYLEANLPTGASAAALLRW